MKISEIIISANRRAVNQAKVRELANSIKQIGLLCPVVLTAENRLIAGLHRIEACKSLGHTEILSVTVTLDDLNAELAEIDENLIRNELSALERGDQLARRKEIYEELYPQTKAGGDKGKNQYQKWQTAGSAICQTPSFVTDAAGKTGRSERVIREEIQISRDIIPEVKAAIQDTPLADKKTILNAIAALPKEEQAEIVNERRSDKEIAKIVDQKDKARKAAVQLEKQELIKQKNIEKTEILALPVNKPKIHLEDCKEFMQGIADDSIDLLFTDPPYSTDIDDLESFVESWLPLALSKVKPDGRAFICIGAYPKELNCYLTKLLAQDKFVLDNPLIWTYRNTLGVTPNMKYNLNYQVVLHLYSEKSRPLDKSVTNEMFSVQDINAPDGRLGNRFHTWQKPDDLAYRLIKHATKENDLILDCFACTGTFVIIADKMKRRVTACDISLENLKIAEERGCEIIQ